MTLSTHFFANAPSHRCAYARMAAGHGIVRGLGVGAGIGVAST